MGSLNNLAVTATNSAMISATGALFNKLQSIIANGGRDNNCKFYYNNGPGGSILQVVAKTVTQGAVNELKDMADNAFNSLMDGKRNKDKQGSAWVNAEGKAREKGQDMTEYGRMKVKGGTVLALDDWGFISYEALMLGIKLDHDITIKQSYPEYSTKEIGDGVFQEKSNYVEKTINTDTLVWYDTTALVTITSDKNLISTRVQGRDYSRKELVSNGDIKFNVTGQITSGKPELYPTDEMQKFIKVMQYKGIVQVNNQVLDQFGIKYIVITDFSITPKQGYKSLQQYSFNAIGLQPETEKEIKEDTITILEPTPVKTSENDDSEWLKMLQNQLEGLKSMASDVFSQGTAIATGLLDSVL